MPWMLQHQPSLALRAQAHWRAGHDGAMAGWCRGRGACPGRQSSPITGAVSETHGDGSRADQEAERAAARALRACP